MSENLKLWDQLGKTDPAQTKAFTRGGGFKGTAVKPIYTEHKMTEVFGACGIGWGFTEPQFQVVPGDNKEVLVYCWLSLWIVQNGKRSDLIPGVGGDKVVSHIKANTQYNRPERWENDDEAFKKAFTDAIGNAMKHLGMSADVHMGRFDDSKYVAERQQEERQEKEAPAPTSQVSSPQSVAMGLMGDIEGCTSVAALDEYVRSPAFKGAFKALPDVLKAQVTNVGTRCREELSAGREAA